MGYRVVVAGATGNVGREMLNILAEREFPADEIAVVASSRSTGDVVDYGETGRTLKVQNIEHFDWKGWDMALFAIGSEATRTYAPIAAAAGCTVILKAAPDTPWSALALGRLIHDHTDFPPGVFNVITSGDKAIGEVLTTSPEVDRRPATGSHPSFTEKISLSNRPMKKTGVA